MLHEIKRVIVTSNTVYGIFDSETRNTYHIAKVSFSRKQYYCSCEDFLFRNNMKMYLDRRVYKCKHIQFLESLLKHPLILRKVFELRRMGLRDIRIILENTDLEKYEQYSDKLIKIF
ncbi:MAG: hypothetical protein ACP5G1_03630 [Nanopusillaceae archaeon]|jgi:phage FluMu protein Com